MKRDKKSKWQKLTLGEKTGVILFYIFGIIAIFAVITIMYLQAPLFW